MKQRKIILSLVGAAVMATGVSAFANTAASTASSSSLGLKDRMAISYLGWYNGQQLSNITGSFQGNEDPEARVPGDAVNLENYLDVAAKLDNNWKLGVVGLVVLNPVGSGAEEDRGMDATLQNPYIKASKSKIINSDGMSLSADFRYYVPVTAASHNIHNMGNLRSSQTFDYEIPNSRFTVGTYSFIRSRLYTDSVAAAGKKELELYISPNAKYQATKSLAAQIAVEPVTLIKSVGKGGFVNDPVTIDPGLSWDITENVNLNPNLNIFAEAPRMDNTSIYVLLSAKLL